MLGVALAAWLLALGVAAGTVPSRAALDRRVHSEMLRAIPSQDEREARAQAPRPCPHSPDASPAANAAAGRSVAPPPGPVSDTHASMSPSVFSFTLAPLCLYTFLFAHLAYVPHDETLATDPCAARRTWVCFLGALGVWWRFALGDRHERRPAFPPLSTPETAPKARASERAALRAHKCEQDQARYALWRELRVVGKAVRSAEQAAEAAAAAEQHAHRARAAARSDVHACRAASSEVAQRLGALNAASEARAASEASLHARLATSTRANLGRAEELRGEIVALRQTAQRLGTPHRRARPSLPELDVDVSRLLPSNLLASGDEAPGSLDGAPRLSETPGSSLSLTPPTPYGTWEPADYLHAGYRRTAHGNVPAKPYGARWSLPDETLMPASHTH